MALASVGLGPCALYIGKRVHGPERSDPYERPNVRARATAGRYATAGNARLSAWAAGGSCGMRAKTAQIRRGAAPATTTTRRAGRIGCVGADNNRKQPMLRDPPLP